MATTSVSLLDLFDFEIGCAAAAKAADGAATTESIRVAAIP
jgi:hypothetical protein